MNTLVIILAAFAVVVIVYFCIFRLPKHLKTFSKFWASTCKPTSRRDIYEMILQLDEEVKASQEKERVERYITDRQKVIHKLQREISEMEGPGKSQKSV